MRLTALSAPRETVGRPKGRGSEQEVGEEVVGGGGSEEAGRVEQSPCLADVRLSSQDLPEVLRQESYVLLAGPVQRVQVLQSQL